MVGAALNANTWHEVTLTDLGGGSEVLQVSVDGSIASFTSSGADPPPDIELLDGPLYIGGHPSFTSVQVATVAL